MLVYEKIHTNITHTIFKSGPNGSINEILVASISENEREFKIFKDIGGMMVITSHYLDSEGNLVELDALQGLIPESIQGLSYE